ncbi:MAG TPA: phosphoglycerate kinase [Candidatus Paceibacterota bacterium]|nr:phosphoglycerate kinase [Candidatus Paceibacterota bacterium]
MSTKPRSVEALTDIFGMRFLVRASLDVPLEGGIAADHFRVRRAIPTFVHLLDRGARVIILTHVGRDPENSTESLVSLLAKHIPVRYVPAVTGDEVYGAVAHMKEGTALLLENLRRDPRETANDPEFARELASYGDFYVNDAFAVSHREHASIVGIPKFLPSFAGIVFMEELNELTKVVAPASPSLFVLGGAKYETKEPLIEEYSKTYTRTFIGGALANDFLKGKGYEVGTSVVSPVDLTGNELLTRENLKLPIDVVVEKGGTTRTAAVDEVAKDEKIVDVGLASLEMIEPYIAEAETILWNGPLGYYEGGFDAATKRCADLIASSSAYSVVGGGDTVAAIESMGLQDKFGFLSTAGGAMLEFLEKRTLPGIEALPKES